MPAAKHPSGQDEYLEQDDEEREEAGRRKSLLALAILALLVVGGVVLAHELRKDVPAPGLPDDQGDQLHADRRRGASRPRPIGRINRTRLTALGKS